MSNAELVAIAVLGAALLITLWKLLTTSSTDQDAALRKELREMNSASTEALRKTLEGLGNAQQAHLDTVSKNIEPDLSMLLFVVPSLNAVL